MQHQLQKRRAQGRLSLAGEMLFGLGKDRRHSASDILLKVLRRRRSSALESLYACSHRVMLAVSMAEANAPVTQLGCRCNLALKLPPPEGILNFVASFCRGFGFFFHCWGVQILFSELVVICCTLGCKLIGCKVLVV